MTVFVTVMLIVAVAVAGWIVLAVTGRGETTPTGEPVRTLPPVLLPDHPRAEDLHRVRFSPALRGYRMDQVDEVMDRLAEALQDRDRQISELTAELEADLTTGDPVDTTTAIRDGEADPGY